MNALLPSPTRWRLALLGAFLLLCMAAGGSARPDNVSLLIVRPLAATYLIVALILPGPRNWTGLRWPLILLGAFAVTIALQLVPLPPALWSALPGHARFLEAAAALNVPQPWRPISVAPDMTFNSLLALLVPLAVLVGAATITPRQRVDLLPVLLLAMIASSVLGIAQWAGSTSSPLYFFRYTNRDLPVGLFANRNHQATFLAMAFPLLRAWSVLPSKLVPEQRIRGWIAGAAALLILPVILASGSRSGFVLAVLGALSTLIVAPIDWRALSGSGARPHRRTIIIVAAILALIMVAGSAVFLGRALSITRLGQLDEVEADLRVRFLPITLSITRDFLPFGTGFGTFKTIFHMYEPFWALKPTNFNRAHNDLLELAMTGGVPAVLALIAFVGFLFARVRAVLSWGWQRLSTTAGKSGMMLVAMAFAASITDYPLRTPTMGVVFALATMWLTLPFEQLREASEGYSARQPGGASRLGRRPRGKLARA